MKTIFDLAKEVPSKFYHVNPDIICDKTNKPQIVLCRHIAIMFICNNTKYTLEVIGSAFNRHHSTVLSSCKKVNNLLETDKKFRAEFEIIEDRFIQKYKLLFSDNKLTLMVEKIKEAINRNFWKKYKKLLDRMEETKENIEVEFENLNKISV